MGLFTLLTGSRWRPLIYSGEPGFGMRNMIRSAVYVSVLAVLFALVMKPAMALPYHLYMLLTQGTSSENAYGTAFVMMMVVLVTNSLAIWFTRRNRK